MNYRYNAVVELIRKRIEAGTLKVGDRLPSIRQLSLLTGFSTVTVHHGYELLESQGVCVARPQSGFYLAKVPPQLGSFPQDSLEAEAEPVTVQVLPQSLLLWWRKKGLEAFGASYPSDDLFDCDELDTIMRRMLRRRSAVAGSEAIEGDIQLRQQIAKRAALQGTLVRYQDIIVTGSAMQGFNLCLDSFTEPGDVILVESPSYFPMLAGVKRRNLQVVELYSHPVTGTDPDQFAYLVRNNRIRVAVLMATHHYPTGVTYSESAMKRIVETAQEHRVTIIENNMLGELAYGSSGTPSLKHFDSGDTVVQFSSFECSLSPQYGLGWIIAGKHARRLLATQYLGGYITRDVLMQRTVAEYLTSRSQDRHLRKLRSTLETRMQHGLKLMQEHFPRDCSVSRPAGGFMCWIRAPKQIDASAVSARVTREQFSILPGPVFSAAGSFGNFLALNMSFAWNEERERQIVLLSNILSGSADA